MRVAGKLKLLEQDQNTTRCEEKILTNATVPSDYFFDNPITLKLPLKAQTLSVFLSRFLKSLQEFSKNKIRKTKD